MALKTVNEESLVALGDAIRARTGGTEALNFPDGMVNAINDFTAMPESALVLTGNQMSAFANNCWNWFIETYGDKITTKGITNSSQMFYNATQLKEIPFDINILTTSSGITNILPDGFYSVNRLSSYPNIYITK